jgi:hypothetical protein
MEQKTRMAKNTQESFCCNDDIIPKTNERIRMVIGTDKRKEEQKIPDAHVHS